MKKWVLFFGLFSILLTGCYNKKSKNDNVSVMENDESLVMEWFGPDHYKDSDNNRTVSVISPSTNSKDSIPSLMTPGGLIVEEQSNAPSPCNPYPEGEHFFSGYLFNKEMSPNEQSIVNESSDFHSNERS